MLLVTEMVVFMSLIIPLPFTWRRKLFTFISESPIIAKLQYGMKVCGRVRPEDVAHTKRRAIR